MNYNWNWGIFWELSPDASGTYLQTLINGLQWTLATGITAWIFALLFGAIVGTMRTAPVVWMARLGDAYVELFRNIPLLVQMFLWFFVVPELLPRDWGNWLKQLPNSSFWTAVVALAFFTSARVAEQVRAGIQSLPRGQQLAGTALGLTLPQTYRYVLLPMAFRIILPPLTSRVPEHHQEQRRRADDRPRRADRARALDAGVQLPGLRGLHRGDHPLPRDQRLRRARHALGRGLGRGAGLRRQGAGRRGALSDVRNLRLRRHQPLLGSADLQGPGVHLPGHAAWR